MLPTIYYSNYVGTYLLYIIYATKLYSFNKVHIIIMPRLEIYTKYLL